MFDAEYFTDLLNETLLITQELKKSGDQTKLDKRKSNILALKCMTDEIDDDRLRIETIKRLENLFEENIFSEEEKKKVGRRELHQSEGAERVGLEKDLLKYVKELKDKAEAFNEEIKNDEDVVKKTSDSLGKSINLTKNNIWNLDFKNERFPISSIYLFGLLFFILIYVLIRAF